MRTEIGGRLVEGAESVALHADGLTVKGVRGGVVTIRQRGLEGWSLDGAPLAPGRWVRATLPAGRTEATLSYRPPGLSLGLALSGVAALALAFGFVQNRDKSGARGPRESSQ